MEISGRTAYVTGGGSGLGAATARALATAGAHVGVIDRDMVKGQQVADEIDGRFFACDISDEISASQAVNEATIWNRPSILVNCAGIGTAARIVGRDGPMPLDAFENVIRINLIGTFNMMRLVAAAMAENAPDGNGQRGVIISTASAAAFEGQIGQAAYAASKGGIVSLTLPAAREFARFGIRVLTIAPGLFLTPLLEELPQESQETLGASIPNPARLGKPEEFADMVLAMARNDYLNGEVVRLDGALRLPPK